MLMTQQRLMLMTQQQPHLRQQLLQQQKEELRQELQGGRSGVILRQFPETGGRGGPCLPLAADLSVTKEAYQGMSYHGGGPAGPGPGYDPCQRCRPDASWGYGGGGYDGGGYVEGCYGNRGCGGVQSARPASPVAGGYYGVEVTNMSPD